ncbi:hypothetical protein OG352_23160 [Streptomyces sp. NBC_01485]|uniref:hypothetical protein n=1 Tax=Streptomyces sp. NBC_01485 TaxID=2903884 RepID=UPI002E33D70A|nr:hypothetical protein [Streptomyces sp. NBC_01485]
MAFAGGTASAAGQQAWQSLRALVLRRPEGERDGQHELTALAEDPGSAERARELAAALAARAEEDPGFAQRLEAWRQEAKAVWTGAGDVSNELSGTAHGPVIMGRDFNGPVNLG